MGIRDAAAQKERADAEFREAARELVAELQPFPHIAEFVEALRARFPGTSLADAAAEYRRFAGIAPTHDWRTGGPL